MLPISIHNFSACYIRNIFQITIFSIKVKYSSMSHIEGWTMVHSLGKNAPIRFYYSDRVIPYMTLYQCKLHAIHSVTELPNDTHPEQIPTHS